MTRDDIPSLPARPGVLVTGATGLVGRALVRDLVASGVPVIALSRDAQRARGLLGEAGVHCIDRLDELEAGTMLSAVVHLAGARVLDSRWSPERQQQLLRSRTDITRQLLGLMGRLRTPPGVLVCASAVSYYGARGPQRCVESDPPLGDGFASRLCVEAERAAAPARELGIRVVPLRLGIVLARGDGALPPLATAARLGLGAVLGSGAQPVAWIHLDDVVGMIRLAIAERRVDGALNAVAPETPTNADFERTLAARFGRRVRLRVPAAAMRLLLGERAVLLLEGPRAVPDAALAAGFRFRFPTLATALADLLPAAGR